MDGEEPEDARLEIEDDLAYVVTRTARRRLGKLCNPDILEEVPADLFEDLFAVVDAYKDAFDSRADAIDAFFYAKGFR